jgi:cyclic pyranopterin phosphate synthase
MPAEIFGERYEFLPREEILSFEEITRLARIFIGLGTEKIRITGGEPLLRREIERLIADLSAIPGLRDLTLTTNGVRFAALSETLKTAGLSRVTFSLDALDPDVFRKMAGRDESPDTVLNAIQKAEQTGYAPIKINTVIKRGDNDSEIVPLAQHFHGTNHILRFIEYMDVGTRNGWQVDHVVPAEEIVARIHDVLPLEPVEPNYVGEVARRYRYVDGGGEVGIIASVTQPFCGDCTRARLSTDGKLVTCLFASDGVDLRPKLRGDADDEDIRRHIEGIWLKRDDRYSETRTEATPDDEFQRIEMYQIGG